jgi:hypothetical protein
MRWSNEQRAFAYFSKKEVILPHLVLPIASRPALGPAQPPIKWLPGVLSPRVKRQWREADHSPLSSAKVKNGSMYVHSTRIHAVMLSS